MNWYNIKTLRKACHWSHLKLAELLLECGVGTPDSLNNELENVCCCCDLRLIKLLVKHGAQDLQGCLYTACELGHIEIVKFLLSRDVDISGHMTEIACDRGHTKIVELLVSEKPPDNITHLNSLLSDACFSGKLELVQLFLDKGAADIESGLTEARTQKNFEIVNSLLTERKLRDETKKEEKN